MVHNRALAEKDFVDLTNEYLPYYDIPPADTYIGGKVSIGYYLR